MAPWKTTKAFIDACAQKAMLQLHGEGPYWPWAWFQLHPNIHEGWLHRSRSGTTSHLGRRNGTRETCKWRACLQRQETTGNVRRRQSRDLGKQKATLSDPQEHDVNDIATTEDEDDRFNVQSVATPAIFDEGTSQISGLTSSSRHPKRTIRITREVELPDGTTQMRTEIVHDPVVISQYIKRRTEADLEMREYVKHIVRFQSLTTKRPPKSWLKLPISVRALHRWARLQKHISGNSLLRMEWARLIPWLMLLGWSLERRLTYIFLQYLQRQAYGQCRP